MWINQAHRKLRQKNRTNKQTKNLYTFIKENIYNKI